MKLFEVYSLYHHIRSLFSEKLIRKMFDVPRSRLLLKYKVDNIWNNFPEFKRARIQFIPSNKNHGAGVYYNEDDYILVSISRFLMSSLVYSGNFQDFVKQIEKIRDSIIHEMTHRRQYYSYTKKLQLPRGVNSTIVQDREFGHYNLSTFKKLPQKLPIKDRIKAYHSKTNDFDVYYYSRKAELDAYSQEFVSSLGNLQDTEHSESIFYRIFYYLKSPKAKKYFIKKIFLYIQEARLSPELQRKYYDFTKRLVQSERL